MIARWEDTQAFRDYDSWKLSGPPERYVCERCETDYGANDAPFMDSGDPDHEVCEDCWDGWKCDGCAKEVGRDDLTVIDPDTIPEFYCAECMEADE